MMDGIITFMLLLLVSLPMHFPQVTIKFWVYIPRKTNNSFQIYYSTVFNTRERFAQSMGSFFFGFNLYNITGVHLTPHTDPSFLATTASISKVLS